MMRGVLMWGAIVIGVVAILYSYRDFIISNQRNAIADTKADPSYYNVDAGIHGAVTVKEFYLHDGTRCVLAFAGGIDCEWKNP